MLLFPSIKNTGTWKVYNEYTDTDALIFLARNALNCIHRWIFLILLLMSTLFATFDVQLKQQNVWPHLCDVHDFDGSQLSSFDMTSLWRHKVLYIKNSLYYIEFGVLTVTIWYIYVNPQEYIQTLFSCNMQCAVIQQRNVILGLTVPNPL